jgi:hypothetical protein
MVIVLLAKEFVMKYGKSYEVCILWWMMACPLLIWKETDADPYSCPM